MRPWTPPSRRQPPPLPLRGKIDTERIYIEVNNMPWAKRVGSTYFVKPLPLFLFSVLILLLYGSNTDTAMNSHAQFFQGEKFTVSSINCNSLNLSQSAKWNQTLKICGITKLKSDIIFLSDIRVSNKNLVSAADDLTRLFQNNPYGKYEFYYNSTMNKRGVGILIKCALQTEVIAKRFTPDENVILLHVKIANTEVILISIYGPNSGDAVFFENLSGLLNEFK
jgi:hypothetical protein